MNTTVKTKNQDGLSASELIVPSLIGVGVGIVTAAVLLLIVSAIVYSTSDPNKLVTPASMIILAVSSFVTGVAGSKIGKSLLTGAISGVAFAAIALLSSLISGDNGSIPAPYSYLVRLASVSVSLLGAYLASRGGGRRFASSPRRPKIKKL